ncbi:MAG: DNA primase, partial [Bacteroidota bacterium]|nr:DNA primase [Bacteroidota bacterium]
LKKSGSSLRGLSPFTNEKTPSFYVLPAKGIFKCFSSGKGGNVVSFLMELEKASYPEALRMLAQRYNIEVEEKAPTPEELAAATAKESLSNLVAWASKWFMDQMRNTDTGKAIGRSYFVERGFRDDVLDTFMIGYSPDSWDAMATAAQEAGYTAEKLVEAGLCKQRDDGSLWDFFKGRVMFPIRDVTGRVIGFGGRTLTTDKKVAKYFNSPESILYNKSKVLYGMHLAKQPINKEERCFLVEGYTDVMAMHQAGVENVVSSSGTALTAGQIHLIRRFTKNVTVIFDGDAAGIRASLRGIDMLLAEGMSVKVVLLPDGDDPDTYAKKVGSDALHRAIHEDAQDFLQFKAKLLSDEAGSDPLKRADMIRSVVTSIAAIPDAIQRSVYLQSSASQLHMDENVLGTEVAKILHEQSKAAAKRAAKSSPYGTPPPGAPPVPTSAPPASGPEDIVPVDPAVSERAVVENDLIRILLGYASEMVTVKVEGEGDAEPTSMEVPFAELVIHRMEEEGIDIREPMNQAVVSKYIEELDQDRVLTADQLVQDKDPGVQLKVAGALVQQHVLSPNWSQRHKIYPVVERDQLLPLLEDSLRRLHLSDLRAASRDLAQKLEAGEMDVEQERDLLAQKVQLDRQIQSTLSHFGTVILP